MIQDTHGERIKALEVQMLQHLETDKEMHKLMDEKLDQLLELRDKGMGAFYIVSLLVGGGFIGAFVTLLNWFKHVIYS